MRARAISASAALVILTLVLLGPLVPHNTAQPTSRYALTAAITDHHTIDLGDYRGVLGVDHAEYRGQLRSDKAVGQPLLAVPAYLVGRALGAESAERVRWSGDLGLWWSTLWSALVPFVALVILMYQFARRFSADAMPAALSIGFGTMMLPLAVNLYGHVLAALFAFGALVVVERANPSVQRLFGAGLLASAAIAVEYHAVIAAAVVFAVVAWRERRRAAWMALGAVPFGVVIAVYQWRAFGAFFHTPFAYYAGELDGTTRGGYSLPGWRNTWAIFVGTRGLLYVAPVALVAIAGAVLLARRGTGDVRRHAWTALAITSAYLILCAGWSGTPLLEEAGPRYAIPALPFLVVPLAVIWSRWRRVATLTAVVGAVFMVSAALTFPLLRIGDTPIGFLRYVSHRTFATNLWVMAFGRFGVILYLASIVAAVLVVRNAFAERRINPQRVSDQGPRSVTSHASP